MATTRWRPAAKATAQVSTVQVSSYAVGTTYKLTVNGKVLSVIAAGSANATATALAAAWNAATDGEFTAVTASASTDTVTLTADTSGVPFIATSSVSGSTGTIGSVTDSTAATGPYHWDNAANWSGGSVPTTGDTVYLDYAAGDVRYGLAQTSVTLAALHILAAYTDRIGLADVNPAGYPEYRDRYLAIKATLLNVGAGDGRGSPRIRLDLSTAQSTIRVLCTGSGSESPLPALQIKGTHASNAAYVTKGEVGFAVLGGETATLATLEVGYATSPSSDSLVRCGSGVTLTTLQQTGGRVYLESGLTTVDKRGGYLEVGEGSVTTLNNYAGEVVFRSTGTITTLMMREGASIDFGRDTRTRTVTNATFRSSFVNDPLGTVTWTNAVTVQGPSTATTLNVGSDRAFAIG